LPVEIINEQRDAPLERASDRVQAATPLIVIGPTGYKDMTDFLVPIGKPGWHLDRDIVATPTTWKRENV
jgi:hypothetical protein